MSKPAVTLFVPTWNAGPEFPEILDLMLGQKLDRPFEMIAIDSGSSDGTVELLERNPHDAGCVFDRDMRLLVSLYTIVYSRFG